jgi:hypothetical protein
MRQGDNPMRRKADLPPHKTHRVIMPVYIPALDGYYQDAFKIFSACLQSLDRTIDRSQVSVTIINNGSIQQAHELIESYVQTGLVDRYIRNTVNRGKADPLVGELRASYESLLTISDADVLFQNGWLDAVENIYRSFPGAGCVASFPSPQVRLRYTSSAWLYGVRTGRLRLGAFANAADLDCFERSLGRDKPLITNRDKALQYTLKREETVALIGSGHFVCTLRREALAELDYAPAKAGLFFGLRSIDEQVDRRGYMRLASPKARVVHMGNVWEPWHAELLAELDAPAASSPRNSSPLPPARRASRLPYWLRKWLLLRPIWVLSEILLRAVYYRRHGA